MPEGPNSTLRPLPVAEALAIVDRAPLGLLALGMPGCAACTLLPVSLGEIRVTRPDLTVAIGEFATVADWALREQLLWPRGIHVSRSSVPALSVLVDGEVVASRPGGGPAFVIERWLGTVLGASSHAFDDQPTPAEAAALDAQAGVIARHRDVKRRRESSLGTA